MNEVIGYVDVRSAEVAVDAIASDVAQVHQDMLDADADATAAAASAAAAAGTLANAVKKTGEASQSIAGDIAVAGDLSAGGDLAVTGDAGVQGNLSVLGGCDLRAPVTVPTPTNNTDAATKKYVDDADALKANKTYVDAQDALKINITDINNYAVGLTGNQPVITGTKTFTSYVSLVQKATNIDTNVKPTTNQFKPFLLLKDKNDQDIVVATYFNPASSSDGVDIDIGSDSVHVRLHIVINSDGGGLLQFITPKGTVTLADTR